MVTFPASITNALDKANGSHASLATTSQKTVRGKLLGFLPSWAVQDKRKIVGHWKPQCNDALRRRHKCCEPKVAQGIVVAMDQAQMTQNLKIPRNRARVREP
jgi:hypothetical protein